MCEIQTYEWVEPWFDNFGMEETYVKDQSMYKPGMWSRDDIPPYVDPYKYQLSQGRQLTNEQQREWVQKRGLLEQQQLDNTAFKLYMMVEHRLMKAVGDAFRHFCTPIFDEGPEFYGQNCHPTFATDAFSKHPTKSAGNCSRSSKANVVCINVGDDGENADVKGQTLYANSIQCYPSQAQEIKTWRWKLLVSRNDSPPAIIDTGADDCLVPRKYVVMLKKTDHIGSVDGVNGCSSQQITEEGLYQMVFTCHKTGSKCCVLIPVKVYETPLNIPILGMGKLRQCGFKLTGITQEYEDRLIAPNSFPAGTFTYLFQTKVAGHYRLMQDMTPKPQTPPPSTAITCDGCIFTESRGKQSCCVAGVCQDAEKSIFSEEFSHIGKEIEAHMSRSDSEHPTKGNAYTTQDGAKMSPEQPEPDSRFLNLIPQDRKWVLFYQSELP